MTLLILEVLELALVDEVGHRLRGLNKEIDIAALLLLFYFLLRLLEVNALLIE